MILALCALLLMAISSLVHAQSVEEQLALDCEVPPELLDAALLEGALERELGVAVQRVRQPDAGPTLRVAGFSLREVKVMLVQTDKPTVGRTIDVSAPGTQVPDTLALLALNLLRDEAAELLPQLPAADGPAAAPQKARPKTPSALAQACAPLPLRRVPVGVDFLPFLGMSMRHGTKVQRTLSFNVIGGITGAVNGFELGSVFNLDMAAMCGAQIAGAVNFVRGPVHGFQLALVNLAAGRVDGVQIGQVDIATGGLNGLQLGLIGFSGRDTDGAQIALASVTGGSVDGLQAGLFNLSGHSFRGAQIGLLNVVGSDADGARIGLANVGPKDSRGAMIGLLNVAENADVAFGLLNVFWKGRTQLDAWATDGGLLNVGVVHGARVTHSIYGVGIRPMNGDDLYSFSLGFGVRTLRYGRLTVDVDALTYGLFRKSAPGRDVRWATVHQLRVPVAFSIVRGVAVFVAPSLSVSVAEGDPSDMLDLALISSTRLTNSGAGTEVRLWPGLSLGVRFL